MFFFFFFNGKPGHRGPTHPILMENSINFFFFFFKHSLNKKAPQIWSYWGQSQLLTYLFLSLTISGLVNLSWLSTYKYEPLYRVSHNTLATLYFAISKLPEGIEWQKWTLWETPFCVDYKTVLTLIPKWILDRVTPHFLMKTQK